MIKAMEACGDRSGSTAFDVMVAGCGMVDTTASAAAGFETRTLTTTASLSGNHEGESAAASRLGARGAVRRFSTALRMPRGAGRSRCALALAARSAALVC